MRRRGRTRTREGGIRGQGYLPFWWRGGQPELLRGGKNENTRRAPRIVVCWNITVSQRMKSWNKVGDASEKNKIGEKYRRLKELLRVGLSLYPVLCERVRDIESMLERERERERETACMCVSEAHWMQRTGCWSAPPPLRSTLRHGWRKQEDVRVMSGVM